MPTRRHLLGVNRTTQRLNTAASGLHAHNTPAVSPRHSGSHANANSSARNASLTLARDGECRFVASAAASTLLLSEPRGLGAEAANRARLGLRGASVS